MAVKKYNATLRNIEYRLRKFKDYLPSMLEDIIMQKEDAIVSAIADDQLYRRGITGKGRKIMSYAPYTPYTIRIKKQKGQPTTRVTLRDTGAFHSSMFIVFEADGFYITASDEKTQALIAKYGEEIFALTNKNFTRIIRSHVRKELVKRIKKAARK